MLTSVGLTIVIVVLLAVIIYLLLTLIKKLKSGESRPPQNPRPPRTFVRGIDFDEATSRWQLTCRNRVPENSDDYDLPPDLPELDRCVTGDKKLAPPLIVKANDVIVFDFSSNGTEEDDFVWVELQFPEPDLFVDLGPNRFDDHVVRVEKGKPLALRVRDRKPCNEYESESRFIYAIHVVKKNNTNLQSPSGYVVGGSPPEIRIKHA